jgi:hypothetical protein
MKTVGWKYLAHLLQGGASKLCYSVPKFKLGSEELQTTGYLGSGRGVHVYSALRPRDGKALVSVVFSAEYSVLALKLTHSLLPALSAARLLTGYRSAKTMKTHGCSR